MTGPYVLAEASAQKTLRAAPYDRWVADSGEVMAEFHREPAGFRVRFPGDADFVIESTTLTVRCEPERGVGKVDCDTLWHNAIVPLLDNYRGSISLHGAACLMGGRAVGFVGASRRGKTTLAAACALAGHPFLAEDAIRLEGNAAPYTALPARPLLRLFTDSAAYLLPETSCAPADADKLDVAASDHLPHHGKPARLAAIYLLGENCAGGPAFTTLGQQAALAELMRHAFILDIEDRARLAAHFDRLAQLAEAVPMIRLDYPRRFDALGDVIERLAEDAKER